MNANISAFFICVGEIICLLLVGEIICFLLYNLHDCTYKAQSLASVHNHFKKGDCPSELAEDLQSYDDDFLPGTAWRERLKIRNVSR